MQKKFTSNIMGLLERIFLYMPCFQELFRKIQYAHRNPVYKFKKGEFEGQKQRESSITFSLQKLYTTFLLYRKVIAHWTAMRGGRKEEWHNLCYEFFS